ASLSGSFGEPPRSRACCPAATKTALTQHSPANANLITLPNILARLARPKRNSLPFVKGLGFPCLMFSGFRSEVQRYTFHLRGFRTALNKRNSEFHRPIPHFDHFSAFGSGQLLSSPNRKFIRVSNSSF